jgi:hypothetical protein
MAGSRFHLQIETLAGFVRTACSSIYSSGASWAESVMPPDATPPEISVLEQSRVSLPVAKLGIPPPSF